MIKRIARFSSGRNLLLQGTALLAMVAPVITGTVAAPCLSAQPSNLPTPALERTPPARKPVLLAQVQEQALKPAPVPQDSGRDAAGFDTISIQPCDPNNPAWRHPENGGIGSTSPGKLWADCTSAALLVEQYLTWSNYLPFESRTLIGGSIRGKMAHELVRGAPDWFFSELFTIQATTANPDANDPAPPRGTAGGLGRAGGPAGSLTITSDRPPAGSAVANRIMYGPMLLSLLETRFQLRIHQAKEEATAYELTIAAGGVKFRPTEPGSCDTSEMPTKNSIYKADGRPLCGADSWRWGGSAMTLDAVGITMGSFTDGLSHTLCSQVIDKTGLTGIFGFHMSYEWQGKDCHLNSNYSPAPDKIFEALEQKLGLKLTPVQSSKDVMVIDRIERPSFH
jgi:uncharacterized protein (TIGR03435 family)